MMNEEEPGGCRGAEADKALCHGSTQLDGGERNGRRLGKPGGMKGFYK